MIGRLLPHGRTIDFSSSWEVKARFWGVRKWGRKEAGLVVKRKAAHGNHVRTALLGYSMRLKDGMVDEEETPKESFLYFLRWFLRYKSSEHVSKWKETPKEIVNKRKKIKIRETYLVIYQSALKVIINTVIWNTVCFSPPIWLQHTACEILVPWLGIEPMSPAVEAVLATGLQGKPHTYIKYKFVVLCLCSASQTLLHFRFLSKWRKYTFYFLLFSFFPIIHSCITTPGLPWRPSR